MVDSRFSSHGASPPDGAFPPAVGVEGEMFRVSIASLLDGAGVPDTSATDEGDSNPVLISIGSHGMIRDLHWSGSMASTVLEFGLATTAPPSAIAPPPALADAHDGLSPVELATVNVPGDLRLPDDFRMAIVGAGSFGTDPQLADLGSAIFDQATVVPHGPGHFVHGGPFMTDGGMAIGTHALVDAVVAGPIPIVDLHLLA
jgi:hypothetical protein